MSVRAAIRVSSTAISLSRRLAERPVRHPEHPRHPPAAMRACSSSRSSLDKRGAGRKARRGGPVSERLTRERNKEQELEEGKGKREKERGKNG